MSIRRTGEFGFGAADGDHGASERFWQFYREMPPECGRLTATMT
ncbi:MAG: hypothetical protein ABSH50_03355 [Bryobacteraceae bacterium]|jgi:hypothetical protein